MSERSFNWRISLGPSRPTDPTAEVPAERDLEFVSYEDPGDESRWGVRNQAFMHRVAQFSLVYVLALGLRLRQNEEVLWFSLIGIGLVMLAAYFASSYTLHTRLARIRIRGNDLYIYSVDDWLQEAKVVEPFPLSYASLSRTAEGVQIHYHDRVVVLKRKDWPDFDAMVRELRPKRS